jgi:hypothetical protein
MNALDKLRAQLTVRAEVTCIENTYIPHLAGLRFTLSRVGKSFADGIDQDGKPGLRYTLPTRVRGIEWLDDSTVRYPLPTRPGHTVTYRITPTV